MVTADSSVCNSGTDSTLLSQQLAVETERVVAYIWNYQNRPHGRGKPENHMETEMTCEFGFSAERPGEGNCWKEVKT